MENLKKTFIVLLIIALKTLSAQGKTYEDYNIGKKVNTSNNYNTGKLDLNVPLYDIKFNGGVISGSIDYLQQIPKGEPTMVGTNWDLNVGGKIVIYNINTSFMHQPQTLKWADGFHSYGYNNCLLPNNPSTISKKQILESAGGASFKPNTFYFDFLGNHGYFVSDNNGKLLVYSENDEYTVTYNGDKCHDIFQTINNFPEIILKDSHGNEYYFGGDFNSTDVYYAKNNYTNLSWVDDGTFTYFTEIFSKKQFNYLSAFYLKKIKLANNKIINFYYKNGNKGILDPFTNGGLYMHSEYPYSFPSKSTLLSNNLYFGKDQSGDFSFYSSSSSNNSSGSASSNTDINYKLAILDSIQIPDAGVVDFSYIQMNNTLTKPFLKKIRVKKDNKTIKDVTFDYKTQSNRVFLQALQINDELYKFDYFDFQSNQNNDYNKAGLLQKITYPAKGYDLFDYESNDVSKINKIGPSGGTYTETLVNESQVVIGQRIKTIVSASSESIFATSKVTNYRYKFQDQSVSSGITTFNFTGGISGNSADPSYSSATTGAKYKSNFDENVRYSHVREEIMGNGGTEYSFTDLASNPDSLKISKKNERGKLIKISHFDEGNRHYLTKFIKYNNFLNNLYPLKEYTSNCGDCKVTDDRFYVDNINTYQPVIPYLPSSVKIQESSNENPTDIYSPTLAQQSHVFYKYNLLARYWHPFVIETTRYLPYPWDFLSPSQFNGKKTVNRTYYAQDLIRSTGCSTGNCPPDGITVGSKYLLYKYMADKNIFKVIIEGETNSNGKSKLLEYQYKNDMSSGNILKLAKERISLANSNFTLDAFSTAELEDKKDYELYDDYGNLLQSRNSLGIPTATIYGYKQNLPIAEIKGMTYGQVMQAYNLDPNISNSYLQLEIVKKSDKDKDAATENTLLQELNAFRTKIEFRDAQITTYTYDPLVGVTNVTSPNGSTESYRYDALGKIQRILDNNGNIIKEYSYNTANTVFHNAEKSQPFIKNDCPPGNISNTPVSYTVPASTYTSIISPEDADQKALDDIAANGQNYANVNGTCTSYVCTITPTYLADIYYSSFQEISTNHIKAYLSLPLTNTSGGAAPNWSNGVFIGTLGSLCRPNSYKYINVTSGGSSWNVSISDTGIVILTSTGGVSSGPISLTFEYDKN